jgi:predicted nuclease with TOPRIM domain
MEKLEKLERLADKVAQNFSEILGERNNLRKELAEKDGEIERVRREMAAEMEELKQQCQLYEEERSQLDSKIDSLHDRLDSILETKVSDILTGA